MKNTLQKGSGSSQSSKAGQVYELVLIVADGTTSRLRSEAQAPKRSLRSDGRRRSRGISGGFLALFLHFRSLKSLRWKTQM